MDSSNRDEWLAKQRQAVERMEKRLQELKHLDPLYHTESIHKKYALHENVELLPEDKRAAYLSFLANLPDEVKEVRHFADGTDELVIDCDKLTDEQEGAFQMWGNRMFAG